MTAFKVSESSIKRPQLGRKAAATEPCHVWLHCVALTNASPNDRHPAAHG
jgi:hypothetical protein